MRLELVFSPEGDIALALAGLVGAKAVRLREVGLQTRVVLVVDVLVAVSAEVAAQMLPVQVVEEDLVVEKVHMTEVAPGVGKDLSLFLTARITVKYVLLQALQRVKPLLSNENQTAFLAHLTEGALMLAL